MKTKWQRIRIKYFHLAMHAESSVNPNPGGRPHPNLVKEGVFKLDGLQDCWIICFVQFQDKGLHGGNKSLDSLK